ncbi:MAG: hypothetical protein JO356_13775 [Acidobacteria bacterium]|nr:hypothetical protein [Acidobacteriota bacterium]
MPKRQMKPGERLAERRFALGLTFRQVHQESIRLAKRMGNRRYMIPASRLHDFETKNVVPSIYRCYTLAWVYNCKIRDLFEIYGIPRK